MGGKIKMLSNALLQKTPKAKLAGLSVGDLGADIPSVADNLPLYDAIEKMKLEESGIAVVTKRGRLFGVLLMPHIESIVALHMSQKHKQTNK
jgi:predicted transcriptional regulator